MKLVFKFEAIGHKDFIYSVTKHVDAMNYEKIGMLSVSKPDKFGTMVILDVETVFNMDDVKLLKDLVGTELSTHSDYEMN